MSILKLGKLVISSIYLYSVQVTNHVDQVFPLECMHEVASSTFSPSVEGISGMCFVWSGVRLSLGYARGHHWGSTALARHRFA